MLSTKESLILILLTAAAQSCKSTKHTADLAGAENSSDIEKLKTAKLMFYTASTTSPNEKLGQNLLRTTWYCKDVLDLSSKTESVYKFSKNSNGITYDRINQKSNEVVPILASRMWTWAFSSNEYIHSDADALAAYKQHRTVAFSDEYAYHGPTQQVIIERIVPKGKWPMIKPVGTFNDFKLTDLGTYYICSSQSNGQKITDY